MLDLHCEPDKSVEEWNADLCVEIVVAALKSRVRGGLDDKDHIAGSDVRPLVGLHRELDLVAIGHSRDNRDVNVVLAVDDLCSVASLALALEDLARAAARVALDLDLLEEAGPELVLLNADTAPLARGAGLDIVRVLCA
eukprot:Amastigsp_a841449_44.p5 type:complete len:139 gc:universal Amastigsp_a841449_44:223-639(+)